MNTRRSANEQTFYCEFDACEIDLRRIQKRSLLKRRGVGEHLFGAKGEGGGGGRDRRGGPMTA